jgi:hypothetical protein
MQAVRVPSDWDKNKIKAFALADNRTAELAEWDGEVMARQVIELMGAGIDVSEFGFENASGFDDLSADVFDVLGTEKGDIEQITFTLHSHQASTVRQALELSKEMGDFGDTGNPNSNGNAITRIVELWLGHQDVG